MAVCTLAAAGTAGGSALPRADVGGGAGSSNVGPCFALTSATPRAWAAGRRGPRTSPRNPQRAVVRACADTGEGQGESNQLTVRDILREWEEVRLALVGPPQGGRHQIHPPTHRAPKFALFPASAPIAGSEICLCGSRISFCLCVHPCVSVHPSPVIYNLPSQARKLAKGSLKQDSRLPQRPVSLLFVSGRCVRALLAEKLMARLSLEAGLTSSPPAHQGPSDRLLVLSAGLDNKPGAPIDRDVMAAAAELGIDITEDNPCARCVTQFSPATQARAFCKFTPLSRRNATQVWPLLLCSFRHPSVSALTLFAVALTLRISTCST